MTSPADLARQGSVVAEQMTRTGNPASAGIVHRLAATVIAQATELDALRSAHVDACPRCGEPVEQPAKGRPKMWCSTRCRQAASRATKRDEMVE